METAKQNPVIRLWPKTRVKLDVVAGHQRRKINATVDALCDDYIKRRRLPRPSVDASPSAVAKPPRKKAEAATA